MTDALILQEKTSQRDSRDTLTGRKESVLPLVLWNKMRSHSLDSLHSMPLVKTTTTNNNNDNNGGDDNDGNNNRNHHNKEMEMTTMIISM